MNITQKEQLMYEIISQISDINTPITFKGGLITKLVLEENGFNQIERHTQDIDANWIGTPPPMSYIVDTINYALGNLQNKYTAVITREYNIERSESAGIALINNEDGEKIVSMDLDIKPLSGSQIYYLGETSIKGVMDNEILADKICAISSNAVYKHRSKDLIDIFSLSHCVNVSVMEIYDACKRNNRKIDSFEAFFNRTSDVEHAYNKLKRIEGKPLFHEIYTYLSVFVMPFAERDFTDKIWQPKTMLWKDNSATEIKYDLNENHTEKSVAKQLEQRQLPQQPTFYVSRSTISRNAEKIGREQTDSKDRRKQKSKCHSIGDD